MNEPGWRLLAMHDPTGRRGLWMRTNSAAPTGVDLARIELCAGREGNDAFVQLSVGEPISHHLLTDLNDVLTYAEVEASGAHMDVGIMPEPVAPNALERAHARLVQSLAAMLAIPCGACGHEFEHHGSRRPERDCVFTDCHCMQYVPGVAKTMQHHLLVEDAIERFGKEGAP